MDCNNDVTLKILNVGENDQYKVNDQLLLKGTHIWVVHQNQPWKDCNANKPKGFVRDGVFTDVLDNKNVTYQSNDEIKFKAITAKNCDRYVSYQDLIVKIDDIRAVNLVTKEHIPPCLLNSNSVMTVHNVQLDFSKIDKPDSQESEVNDDDCYLEDMKSEKTRFWDKPLGKGLKILGVAAGVAFCVMVPVVGWGLGIFWAYTALKGVFANPDEEKDPLLL